MIGTPAGALHGAHGLADHHHEHEADEDAGDDEHLLVGQLALEVERDGADGERHRQAEARRLEHGRGAGARAAATAGKSTVSKPSRYRSVRPEHEQADRLRARRSPLLELLVALALAVELGDPLATSRPCGRTSW